MAGTVKIRSSGKTLRHLALPGAEQWEHWTFRSATESRREKSLALDELRTLPAGTRIALPVRQVSAVSLWLQTTDPTLYREMILVQLEKRGLLKSTDPAPPFYHHVVAQEESRSLVFALLLNPRLPAGYVLDFTGDYDFSAHCRTLPAEGFTFWREENRLVLALTRQGKLAHLHAFCGPEVTADAARELLCLQFQLSWENILVDASVPLHLLGNFSEKEHQVLRDASQKDPISLTAPVPLWRENSTSLVPLPVTRARSRHEKKKRWRQITRYIVGIYLLFLILVLAQFGWLNYQTSLLSRQIKAQAPLVDRLQVTADAWKALQPAINRTDYPQDILLHCVNTLPTEARLTKFSFSLNHALILGECQDAASAFKLLHGLQTDPQLKGWTWTMPQPQLLPSNRAQFQLEGIHGHAPAE